MPPPPEKEVGPGQAFLEGQGHWVWHRDEGFSDLHWEYRGYFAGTMSWLMESAPEQWFTKLSEARWELKCTGPSIIWKNGNTELLELGRESGERLVKGLDGRDYKGHVKAYWEGEKLVVHTYGSARATKLDYLSTREVVDGECRQDFEDRVSGLRGTRIFKLFPFYKIDNQTRKTLQLVTYSASDFVYLCPAMRHEVRPGASILDASGGTVQEEQAYFTISVRDSTTGSEEKIYYVVLKAFQEYTLTVDLFT
mmetsp:Transcript_100637/g.324686  ORF Transcript_100637/g.324686 Transcript_100637/m.324686 type:complete len:252 (-) Transcript_100637:67-822(-)